MNIKKVNNIQNGKSNHSFPIKIVKYKMISTQKASKLQHAKCLNKIKSNPLALCTLINKFQPKVFVIKMKSSSYSNNTS